MSCQPKNPKTLLNLMNIHKTRNFQIFAFQNSKSFNFRVLRQNDEERIYYLHQVKCCRMISPAKSVITLRVRPDKV